MGLKVSVYGVKGVGLWGVILKVSVYGVKGVGLWGNLCY